jgi:hypothetical protein
MTADERRQLCAETVALARAAAGLRTAGRTAEADALGARVVTNVVRLHGGAAGPA